MDADVILEDLVVQWHSHVDFQASPSKIDENNIKSMLELMDFVITIIVNVRGEYSCYMNIKKSGRFELPEPISIQTKLEFIPTNKKMSDEVKEKVTKNTVASKFDNYQDDFINYNEPFYSYAKPYQQNTQNRYESILLARGFKKKNEKWTKKKMEVKIENDKAYYKDGKLELVFYSPITLSNFLQD